MKQLLLSTTIAIYFLTSCNLSGDKAQENAFTKMAAFVVLTHNHLLQADHSMNTFCNKAADAFQAVEGDRVAVVDTGSLHELLDSAREASRLSRQSYTEQDSASGELLDIKNKGLACSMLADSIYARFSGVLDILGSKSDDRSRLAAGLISTQMIRRLAAGYRDCELGYLALKEKYHYVEMDSTMAGNLEK